MVCYAGMKQPGTRSSSVPSSLMCGLAFVRLCLEDGGEATDQEMRGVNGLGTGPSQPFKSRQQQQLRNDAAPYVGELSLGPHNNIPPEVLNSTDLKYMVGPRVSLSIWVFCWTQIKILYHACLLPRH
jgi:hypothetical protein